MRTGSLEIASAILFIVFGGSLLGMAIARHLPDHHLSSESKAAVSVSMAVVGTMTALVISLLISSASTSFRERDADVARLSSDIVQLDAVLRRYGAGANEVRAALQAYAAMKYADLFSRETGAKRSVDNPESARKLDEVQDRIFALKPADDRQRWLGAQALQLAGNVSSARSILVEQDATSVPLPFLGAVALWLAVLFASFGLFAPRNMTVIVSLFLCALGVASAVKLILDLDTPFEGRIIIAPPPIHLSGEPMRNALHAIGRPDAP